MKFFLISAALVAVAVAVPVLVQPGDMGPAPIDFDQSSPIYVGPAIVESQQKPSLIQIVINVDSQGRVDIDNPIDVGPVIVDQVPEQIEDPQPAPVIIPEPVLPIPQPSPVLQESEQLN